MFYILTDKHSLKRNVGYILENVSFHLILHIKAKERNMPQNDQRRSIKLPENPGNTILDLFS